MKLKQNTFMTKKIFKKNFLSKLAILPWHEMYAYNSPEDMYNWFDYTFSTIIETNAPLKLIKIYPNKKNLITYPVPHH